MDITGQKHLRDLERLRKLRPIDDDFMRCLFKDNIPLAETVLRIITGKPKPGKRKRNMPKPGKPKRGIGRRKKTKRSRKSKEPYAAALFLRLGRFEPEPKSNRNRNGTEIEPERSRNRTGTGTETETNRNGTEIEPEPKPKPKRTGTEPKSNRNRNRNGTPKTEIRFFSRFSVVILTVWLYNNYICGLSARRPPNRTLRRCFPAGPLQKRRPCLALSG